MTCSQPASAGTAVPELRLREPADIVVAVPYLLGFHPTDSVVAMAVRDSQLLLNARVDTPPINAEPAVHQSIATELVRLVCEQSATGVVVVGYGSATRVTPVVRAVRHALDAAGLRLLDALRVADGRYWSYLCARPQCCPAEGTAFDPQVSAVAATATFSGLVALPDRATLAQQVAPVDAPQRAAMRRATERARQRLVQLRASAPDETEALGAVDAARDEMLGQALRHQSTGAALGDDETAWLSVLLDARPLTNPHWFTIAEDPGARAAHRRLLSDLVRRVEPDLLAEPGSLLAFAAWRDGDGVLASLVLERVLETDPGHQTAHLLAEVLARGIPPSRVTRPLSGPGAGLAPA